MTDRLVDQTTALVISFNEQDNIERCLSRLQGLRRVIALDSGSTDKTLEIISRFSNVEVLHRKFDSFAEQCNFGLSQVRTRWVLSLDADYELSAELVSELAMLREGIETGFESCFVYRIYGRPLRASLYPPRCVLYRVEGARYLNEGHGHRIKIIGERGLLNAPIYHDDRKPLSRWFESQKNYARKEASFLVDPGSNLRRVDKLRRLAWPAPIAVFLYTSIWKGCLFDGWAGWYYVLQRTVAELMIALDIIDRKLLAQVKKFNHRGPSTPT